MTTRGVQIRNCERDAYVTNENNGIDIRRVGVKRDAKMRVQIKEWRI